MLEGTPAERVLDRLLRDLPSLTALQRQAVAEAVFGVGLWRRRLKAELGLAVPGADQLLAALMRDLGGIEDVEPLFGWPTSALPKAPQPPASLADRYSLPDWLAKVLLREVPDEAAALADALNLPGPVCLRANAARIHRDALARQLIALNVEVHPTRFAPHGLVITSPRPNIYGLPPFQEGLFEAQDEGSQLLAELACAQSGEEVLDYCAGAGGKTLALAASMGTNGHVHAYDVDLSALERLRQRTERAQAHNVVIHRAPPVGRTFDAVLVDAPCSELGALRRGPDKRFLLDPASLSSWPEKQRAILDAASTYVRPGGRLIYATCTFASEENEQVARGFEADHRAFIRQRPPLDPSLLTRDDFLRTYPHRHDTDGFFAATWVNDHA
jgi:16S rRNA (cytosine967-C5)-methyltransferase